MTTLKQVYGNDRPTIPDALIRAMTDKELQFMIKWNGRAAATKDELTLHASLLTSLRPYLNKMSTASRTALFQAATDRKAGVTMHVGNAEQSLWKTGGAAYYNKDSMIMVQGSGAVSQVPNTIIPDPIGRRKMV